MKLLILLFSILTFAAIVVIFLIRRRLNDKYKSEILEEREGKNHFFRTSKLSPFGDTRSTFKGLNYFDPNVQYRVNAKLIKLDSGKVVSLATSTSDEENFIEYAHVEFHLEEKLNRLLVFAPVQSSDNELFLAFKDTTNANETYGAGRYLEIKQSPDGATLLLDFNKAYNPYCAYNESYSCPLPPRENHLTVAIKAGEKKY